ncbi:hypothetical protein PR003_g14230 [Phytophthora rubi]|uniref:Uncharacterized protein n=1 Tax=Phytophthora rubi TaxID=129364 RepID=A0A6A4F4H2_9STRA|nr:hypothetical protein PR001_g13553 [Phytophthora rubi]KAE9333026.1 hypothetical protein PR003_g14230 [Phytophthora rubi]
MKERLAEILALRSVVVALHQEDMVKVLGEVTIISDEYLPVLEFLMAPENLTCLISSMLQEPTPTAKATAAAAREPGEPPSYEEYATAFRAHWVLCGSGFSHQLLAALSALKGEPRALVARTLAEFNSRDSMTLETFSRFLTAFMDQYSPQMFMSLFDACIRQQKTFLESLLLLVFYEPVRDVMVRLCNELQGADAEPEVEALVGIALLQLSPMNPVQQIRERVHEKLHQRVAKDVETVRFARMVFTCDLLTDLIHEKRESSLGFAMMLSLSESGPSVKQLIEAAVRDLCELPTLFANESYALKVLNSLLQQTQCGCVTKAAFCRASATIQDTSDRPDQSKAGESGDRVLTACTQGSPHEDLPLIWHEFLTHLPTLLAFFSSTSPDAASLQWRFKPTHVQLVYLMLPVLNVSCTVADTLLIRNRTLDALLELIFRFPKASILHCAIARLFIVALEDSPYMFGKELPAFRSPTDPLRVHLLLGGVLDFVLQAFGWTTVPQQDVIATQNTKNTLPPPAFLDVAISLDQALTSAFAHSAQLFMGNSAFERWKVFRLVVLLPIQTLWEEQYQPPPAVDMGPSPMLAAMLYGETCHNPAQEDAPIDAKHHKERKHSTDGITAAMNAAISVQIKSTEPPDQSDTIPNVEDGGNARLEAPTVALAEDATKAPTQVPTQEGPCVTVLISQPPSTSEASAPAVHDVPTPLSALYNDEEKRMMLKVSGDGSVTSSPPIALVMPATVPQTT